MNEATIQLLAAGALALLIFCLALMVMRRGGSLQVSVENPALFFGQP